MFHMTGSFNQPVGAWDVGQVTRMDVRRRPCRVGWWLEGALLPPDGTHFARAVPFAQEMFYYAGAFNQPVEAWDVDQVTRMDVRRRLRQEPGEVRGGSGWGAVLCHCSTHSAFICT